MPTLSGFGLRYLLKLASADTKFYQAWLWQASYGGSSSSVRLSNEGSISMSWGLQGSDIYVPILAAHAEVKGLRVTTELDDLVGAGSDEWRLEIRQGDSHADIDNDLGTRIFLGRILADVYQDSTMGGTHVVDVQAVDGLGALQEIPYYDTDTDPGERIPYTGREALLTILIRALGKLDYALPIRSAIAWRPTTVSGAEDTLAEVDVDNLSFYSPEGEAMSCYGVVEEIARRLGARLCQYNGAWWIVSRELQTGSTYTYFKYDSAGSADGTDTEGTPADTGGASVIKTQGNRSFRPAFSAVGVRQNHGIIPPIIDEGDFTVDADAGIYRVHTRFWTTSRPAYVSGTWSYTGNAVAREAPPDLYSWRGISYSDLYAGPIGSDAAFAARNFVHSVPSYFHGSSRDAETVKSKVASGDLSTAGPHYAERTSASVDSGTFITLTATVLIEHNDGEGGGLFTPYWSLTISGTDYYLLSDGTWAQSTVTADKLQYAWPKFGPAGRRFGEFGINLEAGQSFSVTSIATPATGAIVLRLYGTSDVGSVGSNDLDPGDTLWDDVAVLVVDKSGEATGAIRTEVFIVDADDPAREDIQVITGEGPGVQIPTTLTDAGTSVSDWTSTRLASARDLGVIHAETVLRSQTSPLEARHETYRNLSANPIAPIKVGSTYYPTQYLQWSIFHHEISGEWVELFWDSSSTVVSVTAPIDPGGTQLMPVSGGSVSGTIVDAAAIPGGQSIRTGIATVTGTSGAGGTVTVTPPLLGTGLSEENIQLTPHTNAAETHFGLENVTSTTFDIRAITSDDSDVTFTWWVIDAGAGISALYGEWHFDEARNSHHLLTAGF